MNERRVLARPIVTITNSPRDRPRKLTKLASLSRGEALPFPHGSGCRDSSDTGGHNVQIDRGNRFRTRVDHRLHDCVDRGRCHRPRRAMGRHRTQCQVECTAAVRRMTLAQTARRNVPPRTAPYCLDPLVMLEVLMLEILGSPGQRKALSHVDGGDKRC